MQPKKSPVDPKHQQALQKVEKYLQESCEKIAAAKTKNGATGTLNTQKLFEDIQERATLEDGQQQTRTMIGIKDLAVLLDNYVPQMINRMLDLDKRGQAMIVYEKWIGYLGQNKLDGRHLCDTITGFGGRMINRLLDESHGPDAARVLDSSLRTIDATDMSPESAAIVTGFITDHAVTVLKACAGHTPDGLNRDMHDTANDLRTYVSYAQKAVAGFKQANAVLAKTASPVQRKNFLAKSYRDLMPILTGAVRNVVALDARGRDIPNPRLDSDNMYGYQVELLDHLQQIVPPQDFHDMAGRLLPDMVGVLLKKQEYATGAALYKAAAGILARNKNATHLAEFSQSIGTRCVRDLGKDKAPEALACAAQVFQQMKQDLCVKPDEALVLMLPQTLYETGPTEPLMLYMNVKESAYEDRQVLVPLSAPEKAVCRNQGVGAQQQNYYTLRGKDYFGHRALAIAGLAAENFAGPAADVVVTAYGDHLRGYRAAP